MEELQSGRPTAVRTSPPATALAGTVTPPARGPTTPPQLAPIEPGVSSPTSATVVPPQPTAPVEVVGAPFPIPTPAPVVTIAPPTIPTLSNEQRWRAQQVDRTVLDPRRVYTTTGSELWWYDPVNQQHVILGSFAGDFEAQAIFTLRSQGLEALEISYQVNQRYVTGISPAIVDRIKAAGYDEWIETYVFVTPNVKLR